MVLQAQVSAALTSCIWCSILGPLKIKTHDSELCGQEAGRK